MLFLFIFLVALVLQLFLPWWIIALAAFALCFFRAVSGGHAFRHSFAAIFILWSGVALYQTVQNQNLLARRVGEMFMLTSENNWIVLVLITGLVGGLAAAIAGLAGYYSRAAFSDRHKKRAV